MTRTFKDVKELGSNIAGTDGLFFLDPAQDIAAVHVGFLKDGKIVTKTISIGQASADPNLEDLLKNLKGELDK